MVARALDQRVYLGFIDDEISNLLFSSIQDETDPYCTKVGGCPVWLVNDTEIPRCGLCGESMEMILQAYSPLDILPSHERVIYIFSCIKLGCSSKSEGYSSYHGWCALRLQLPVPDFVYPANSNNTPKDPSYYNQNSTFNTPNISISPNANNTVPNTKSNTNKWNASTTWETSDWTIDDGQNSGEAATNDLEDLLLLRDALSLHSKSTTPSKNHTKVQIKKAKNDDKNNQKTKQDIPKQQSRANGFFVPHYMVVEEEVDVEVEVLEKAAQQMEFPQDDDDTEEWIGEEYEYTPNRTLSKFLKKLAANPTQCVRYVFGGAPLLMCDEPALSSIPPCSCGEPRVFEFQVMSTLIYLLNCGRNKSNLDFGVVAIFVCSKSCTTSNCQREHVYVQPEIND